MGTYCRQEEGVMALFEESPILNFLSCGMETLRFMASILDMHQTLLKNYRHQDAL